METIENIFYKEGYKYQLSSPYSIITNIFPDRPIIHEFFTLTPNGTLQIRSGYAWDGASGPTVDTKSSMRGSLVHDCFCQMLHNKELDYDIYASLIHNLFYRILKEDKMFPIRAWYWHRAVVIARGGDPEHEDDNPELSAP
jgi:hypothetical protein